jgi:hypothetical protein
MKAMHCFIDSDLRCGHDGLSRIASKAGVRIEALAPGSMGIFFNTKLTKAKVLSSNGVMAYARFDGKIPSVKSLNVFADAVRPGETLTIPRYVLKKIEEVLGVESLKIAA